MTNQIVPILNEQKFMEIAQNYVSGPTGIAIAPDYDVNAATKDLYLKVLSLEDKAGRPALQVVTPQSVELAIRKMINKGLNPIKNQCYPIVYGNKLEVQESYFGKKRAAYTANREIVKGSIRSQVIYEGDVFEDRIMPDGRRELVKHTQPPFAKRSSTMIGAYASVKYKSGETEIDVMTMDEIKAAWAKSKTSGGTHREFPHEMACKSVEGRLAKKLYNSTDESVDGAEELQDIINRRDEAMDAVFDIVEDDAAPLNSFLDGPDTATPSTTTPRFEQEDDELPDLPQSFDEFETAGEEVHTIPYGDWKNKWSESGEWEQVKDSYDKVKKTVQVRRVKK